MSSGSVTEVKEDGELLAIIIHRWDESPGIRFFTGPELPLQVGWMKREAGHVVPAHRHLPVGRRILCTAEVLFLKRGCVRLYLFGRDPTRSPRTYTLNDGDMVLLLGGGHSLEVIEESVIYEVKTGPYDPNDKVPI